MFEFLSYGCIPLLAQAEQVVEVVETTPFFKTGWFALLSLIAAVTIGWFLAKSIASGLKLSEYGGRISVVLIATLVASLMIFANGRRSLALTCAVASTWSVR